MQIDKQDMGSRIKQARLDAKMTQKQLAEKCGMADSAIRKYESGRIVPKIETAAKIAAVLNVPLSDFYSDPEYITTIEAREYAALEALTRYVRVKTGFAARDNTPVSADIQKQWILEKIPDISKRYAVSEKLLEVDAPNFVEWRLNDTHAVRSLDELPDLYKLLIQFMDEMTLTGQKVAVARVEELAQIPKYQKKAPTDSQSAETAEPNSAQTAPEDTSPAE